MTNKPIIEIDVRDEKFLSFLEQFKIYDQKLKDMPAEWAALGEAMEAASGAFDPSVEGAAQLKAHLAIAATSTAAIVTAIHEAAKAQHNFSSETTQASDKMTKLHATAKGVASEIFGIGRWMLKVGSIGGITSTVLGGFGLDRLANSAFGQTKEAAGLGVTPGQLAAWRTDMAPLVGDNLLQGVANAQNNQALWGWFSTLGINPAQAQHEPATQLADQVINASRAAYRENPSLLSAQAQAFQALGGNVADWRRIGTANAGNVLGSERASVSDAHAMGFGARTAAEWTKLNVELNKAGIVIESALIRGLAPLTPIVGELAHELAGLVRTYMPDVKEALQEFATWLKSPAFKADLHALGEDVSAVAAKFRVALELLHALPTPDKDKAQVDNTRRNIEVGAGVGATTGALAGSVLAPLTGGLSIPAGAAVGGAAGGLLGWLDPNLLNAVKKTESGGNPKAVSKAVSKAGAEGAYQLMPGTAKDLGVDPFDQAQARKGAAEYLAYLGKQFGGDEAKALAAYNWGPKHVRDDIAKYGPDWRSHLPAETQNYLKRVMAAAAAPAQPKLVDVLGQTPQTPFTREHWLPMPASPPPRTTDISPDADRVLKALRRQASRPAKVNLTVNNNTSARVAVSANAAAAS